MRKIFCWVVLVLILLVFPASAVTLIVNAPDETVVSRNFNVSIIADLGTITVNDGKLAGFEIYLEYDKTKLTLENVYPGNDTLNWQVYYGEVDEWTLLELGIPSTEGLVKIIGVYNGDNTLLNGTAELFKAQFRANLDGDVQININGTMSKLVRKDEATMAFTTTPDTVTVWKYGDVNKDNSVDVKDLVRLEKIILGEEGVTVTSDIDNDGSVDVADLIMLINYLLGV